MWAWNAPFPLTRSRCCSCGRRILIDQDDLKQSRRISGGIPCWQNRAGMKDQHHTGHTEKRTLWAVGFHRTHWFQQPESSIDGGWSGHVTRTTNIKRFIIISFSMKWLFGWFILFSVTRKEEPHESNILNKKNMQRLRNMFWWIQNRRTTMRATVTPPTTSSKLRKFRWKNIFQVTKHQTSNPINDCNIHQTSNQSNQSNQSNRSKQSNQSDQSNQTIQ